MPVSMLPQAEEDTRMEELNSLLADELAHRREPIQKLKWWERREVYLRETGRKEQERWA